MRSLPSDNSQSASVVGRERRPAKAWRATSRSRSVTRCATLPRQAGVVGALSSRAMRIGHMSTACRCGSMADVRVWVRKFPVAAYAIAAFMVSWAFVIPLAVEGQAGLSGPVPTWFHHFASSGPLIVALVLTGLVGGRSGLTWLFKGAGGSILGRGALARAVRLLQRPQATDGVMNGVMSTFVVVSAIAIPVAPGLKRLWDGRPGNDHFVDAESALVCRVCTNWRPAMLDRATRFTLVALQLFLGITTLFGAVRVVPLLPLEWLTGTPFPDYTVPALALGAIGIGALVSAALLALNPGWGVLLTILVGAAMATFELVETLVIGLDVWLYALHLAPHPDPSSPSLAGADVGTFLGIPTPLWLQPFYFVYGLVLTLLAVRLFVHGVRPAVRRVHAALQRRKQPFMSTRSPLPTVRGLTVPIVLSGLVVGLLLLTALAGLRFGVGGLYRPDPGTLPAFIGQDLITLFVALPLLVTTLWQVRHGSLRALLLWSGLLVYIAYSYAYYLISPEFNPLYLAYISIVSMSGYALLYLLLSIDADMLRTRFNGSTPVRWAGGFLVLMALLMAAKWISSIVAALAAGTQPSAKDLGVWPMDLVVAFPAMCWGGIWLWRRHALGYLVGALLLVKAASVGLTLVVASWLVTWWGEPIDPMLPAYAAIGFGGVVLSVLYLRSVDAPPSARASRSSDQLARSAV